MRGCLEVPGWSHVLHSARAVAQNVPHRANPKETCKKTFGHAMQKVKHCHRVCLFRFLGETSLGLHGTHMDMGSSSPWPEWVLSLLRRGSSKVRVLGASPEAAIFGKKFFFHRALISCIGPNEVGTPCTCDNPTKSQPHEHRKP